MSAETALVGRLVFLATDADDRIFPGKMPQQPEAFPLIVYKRISGPRVYAHDGDSQLIEPRLQLSLWGKSFTEVDTLADQVRTGISGWRDDSVGVQHCFIMFELDEWEEQTGLFRKLLDAQIGYKGL